MTTADFHARVAAARGVVAGAQVYYNVSSARLPEREATTPAGPRISSNVSNKQMDAALDDFLKRLEAL